MFQITPEPPSRPPSMISDYFMFSLLVLPFWVLSIYLASGYKLL
jgi:hypothetical protein